MLRDASEKFGVKECVLGMAHRGRLNTLVNIFKKPVRDLFSEFEGKDFEDENLDGDVKYHLGLTLSKTYKKGQSIKMNLVPNPSHLETVGAVAEGIARAKIDRKYKGDNSRILPIIIHGDAAIAGQGIVYEVTQMSQLNGYKTGGTITCCSKQPSWFYHQLSRRQIKHLLYRCCKSYFISSFACKCR